MPDEPLRTTTFMLTRADALAFEQASSRLTPLATMALVLWLILCGSAAWLIPADWAGAHFGWSFSILVSILIAIGYVLVLLVMSVRQWWRAGRRIRRPQEITLTEWTDRLEIVGGGEVEGGLRAHSPSSRRTCGSTSRSARRRSSAKSISVHGRPVTSAQPT